ncbi:MAG: thermonuclease family protein [Magnetococcales bacterium]|nr:thermonuclease family protein [Magnetococcales bacterium]
MMRTMFLNRLSFIILIALFIQGFIPVPLRAAEQWEGVVVYVLDGDSIKVKVDGRVKVVRLKGIDAPEKGQPHAEEASLFVRHLTLHQPVTLKVFGLDKYERVLAEVTMKDGLNLNQEIVRRGLAWQHIAYSKDKTLRSLEREARDARLGLWAEANPEPPWVWKRQHGK